MESREKREPKRKGEKGKDENVWLGPRHYRKVSSILKPFESRLKDCVESLNANLVLLASAAQIHDFDQKSRGPRKPWQK